MGGEDLGTGVSMGWVATTRRGDNNKGDTRRRQVTPTGRVIRVRASRAIMDRVSVT